MSPQRDPETRRHKPMMKIFAVNALLLARIEPCRGEATRTDFSDDLNLDLLSSPALLRKFLDSFALICATSSKGSENASAACLEHSGQNPAVLRIAQNGGFDPNDLCTLKLILNELRNASMGVKTSVQAESDILDFVAELDEDRIITIIEKAAKRGGGVKTDIETALAARPGQASDDTTFGRWIKNLPSSQSQWHLLARAQRAKAFVIWASHARWTFAPELQALLGYRDRKEVPWLEDIYKISRYYSSIKSMVKFAVKQPRVFNSIQIQDLQAPKPEYVVVAERDVTLLKTTVERLTDRDWTAIAPELSELWGRGDGMPEYYFAKQFPLALCLHAEMQLVDFYKGNPFVMPSEKFIGTSKKACYLCHEYLTHTPLKVSASHQKLYPTWMLPKSCTNSILFKLKTKIDDMAKVALERELQGPRLPRGRDSTAGPTLTATATVTTEFRRRILARNRRL